jgi:hypothetical protein
MFSFFATNYANFTKFILVSSMLYSCHCEGALFATEAISPTVYEIAAIKIASPKNGSQ